MLYLMTAVGILGVAYLYSKLHRKKKQRDLLIQAEFLDGPALSLPQMDRHVHRLGRGLPQQEKVTAPRFHGGGGHVWKSPGGQRVYMN